MADPAGGRYHDDEVRWSDLMSRAQAGDESGYRKLLAELADMIHAYLCSRFGDHHFVEDCVQEVLLAVHQARHTYDPKRKFRPWLFAIVRHKAIDHLRRQQSQQRIVERQAEAQEEPGQADVENIVVRGRLLESLPQAHREALMLTKIVGLSTREASAQLKISEGALKVRVHRAINGLQKMLAVDSL